MDSKLNTNRFNGWTNKDTYLYSLTIDNDDQGNSFRKVVKISKDTKNFNKKKMLLINVLTKLNNTFNLKVENVNFDEIVNTYKKETPITIRSIIGKAKQRKQRQ